MINDLFVMLSIMFKKLKLTMMIYPIKLPLTFSNQAIHIGGKSYTGDRVAILAVFPHPDHPHRYVAIHGGVSPDAVTWGSHLDMQLLPDYIVYCGGETLDWGFWSNEWDF